MTSNLRFGHHIGFVAAALGAGAWGLPAAAERSAPAPIEYRRGGQDGQGAAQSHQLFSLTAPVERSDKPGVEAPELSASNPGAWGYDAPEAPPALFEPATAPAYDERGVASWYGPGFNGQPTANGEIFDMNAMTAAHPSLPLPSLVQVVNLDNGREIVVRVNDRGPFVEDRVIDLSHRAAAVLGFASTGTANVRVRYLGPGPALAEASLEPRPAIVEAPAEPVRAKQDRSARAPASAPVEVQSISAPVRAAAAPRPAPATPATDVFFVQAGAFSDIANAQKFRAELGPSVDVTISPARVRGSDFFRVLIGPVDSRSAADTLQTHLVRLGIDNGFVVAGTP